MIKGLNRKSRIIDERDELIKELRKEISWLSSERRRLESQCAELQQQVDNLKAMIFIWPPKQ